MNEDALTKALAEADQNVVDADKLVRAQEAEVTRVRNAGLNTTNAENLLKAYRYGAQLASEHRNAVAHRKGT